MHSRGGGASGDIESAIYTYQYVYIYTYVYVYIFTHIHTFIYIQEEEARQAIADWQPSAELLQKPRRPENKALDTSRNELNTDPPKNELRADTRPDASAGKSSCKSDKGVLDSYGVATVSKIG